MKYRQALLLLFIGLLIISQTIAQTPFITSWKTDNPGSSNSTSIAIPTHASHTYNYDVDWDEDGIYDDKGVTGPITHDYGVVTSTKISIRGIFPRIHFDNGGDRLKLLSINQWGDIVWENLNSAFDGCANVVEVASDAPDLSVVASMSEMFRRATSFTGDLSNWDVSNVPWMVSMFLDASSFNGDISNWDVGNVNSIRYMFNRAAAFNQDISGWDISNVTTLQHIFHDATAFDQDLGEWDVNQVTDMTSMFDDCGLSRSNYDKTLNGWAEQSGLQNGITLGANNLDYCNGIKARAVLSSGPNNWTIIGDILDCTGATFITTWKTDNPGNSNSTSINIPTHGSSTYNYDIDWENDGTFDDIGVTGDMTHDYGIADTYKVAIRGDFPWIIFSTSGDDNEKLIDIDQWGEIAWTSFGSSFQFCTELEYSATDAPDLSAVSTLSSMYKGCSKFNGAIGDWNVSNVTDMSFMFWGAEAFNQDIGAWQVDSVTSMGYMFNGADAFNQDIGGWKVGNVTSMGYMFNRANAFNQDIGAWQVDSVTSMSYMFRGANAFNQDIGGWQVGNVTNMRFMFWGAEAFNQDISGWQVGNVTDMTSMFRNAYLFDQNLGNWNIGNLDNMQDMLDGSGLSATNYDATLLGWASTSVQPNVSLGAENLIYCNGATAHSTLTSAPNNWTISGDTEDCDNILPCTATTTNTWISATSEDWQNASPGIWSQGSVPTVCDDVITAAGVTITVAAGQAKARCSTLEVVVGGIFIVNKGGVLEVWAE